ncbi:MAG: hypothetical protein K1Y02_01160 [Candidatus Hydrogenedentes bacterium]|nr:hypothetical protein [Candidatus Hydrogenedentota bacterium]
MMRRVFQLWPNHPMVGIVFYSALLVPTGFYCWAWYSTYAYGLAENADYIAEMNALNLNVLRIGLSVAATVYGAYRVFAFHPIFNAGYFLWLRSTPYNGKQELPLGPLELVIEDLPFVLLCLGLSIAFQVTPWYGSILCLFTGYALVLGNAAYRTRELQLYAALGFVLPAALLLGRSTVGGVALLLVLPPLLRWAAAYSLEGLPWNTQETGRPNVFELSLRGNDVLTGSTPIAKLYDESEVGWPLSDLGPREEWPHISHVMAALVALWAGLVVTGGFLLFGRSLDVLPNEVYSVSGLCLFATLAAVCVRIAVYTPRTRSPLSIVARIRLKRILIPSHDRVHVPSIAALLIAAILPPCIYVFTTSAAWLVGITFGVCTFVLLRMGPTLKSWRLTGSYRLQRSTLNGQNPAAVAQRTSSL